MGRPKKPKPAPKMMDRQLVIISGVEVTLYSTGYLAKALRRSSACIRKWQLKGIIMPPVLKPDEYGRRWYTIDEVHTYQTLMQQENIRNGVSFAKTQFSARVKVELLAIRQKYTEMLKGTSPNASTAPQTTKDQDHNTSQGIQAQQ